ncbi:hypothetical protein [Novosphingobium naphthalenivorans]|uniref:hypothetical protein n=1 Tax=Novosphingobium naphthalenivorans TaxID=273168 RepID=UPI0012EE8964|nr:hypothetical protein [Novosphingobium naphthalenivorans]
MAAERSQINGEMTVFRAGSHNFCAMRQNLPMWMRLYVVFEGGGARISHDFGTLCGSPPNPGIAEPIGADLPAGS